MLHKEEIIREIIAMLEKAGDRELKMARAFIRALTED